MIEQNNNGHANAPIFKINDDWGVYEERLVQFFIANDTKNDKKAAILITAISNDVYKLLRSLCFPDKPAQKSFDELCKVLKSYFATQICIFRERAKFYDAKQNNGESVIDWLSRLKQLATECNFENLLDNLLRDKFITGLIKGPILDKALEMDVNAKLQDCVAAAIRKETNIKHQFNEVHKISKTRGNTNYRHNGKTQNEERTNIKCFACGKSNHSFKSCKYRKYACKICKKKGHLATVYKSKNNEVQYLETDDSNHE